MPVDIVCNYGDSVLVPIKYIEFDESEITEGEWVNYSRLEQDIREQGIINDIMLQAPPNNSMMFKIISGRLRFVVCKRLGWTHAPCRVVACSNDARSWSRRNNPSSLR